MNKQELAICWFRRDLRTHDNVAFHYALRGELPILTLFIFDKNILDKLEDKDDRRVTFIHDAISAMEQTLNEANAGIITRYGKPLEVFKKLAEEYTIKAIYTNHDYEPYGIERDNQVKEWAESQNILFQSYKDQVIFEKDEILTKGGKFYSVFTPYARNWRSQFTDDHIKEYETASLFGNLFPLENNEIIPLEKMGFTAGERNFPDKKLTDEVLKNYKEKRNIPAVKGTSRLSVHLRFGTISIREVARQAIEKSDTYMNELTWRDFYAQVLYHNPRIVEESFRPEYDAIPWENNTEHFEKWCAGKTGYPIVDAGMRELNETGYMHNRVRMIVASFLTKHLLIDWRWGERYFARKLLDFDLASNNGGWQWAAGSGTDAQPYFRIFNPYSQTDKFDPNKTYIKKWVKEINSSDYPKPIVDHKAAREKALEVYKSALNRD